VTQGRMYDHLCGFPLSLPLPHSFAERGLFSLDVYSRVGCPKKYKCLLVRRSKQVNDVEMVTRCALYFNQPDSIRTQLDR
jgi:hypothetical protein